MSIIQIDSLIKDYKSYKRYSGFFGSVKSLFTKEYTLTRAVNNLSFSISQGEAIGYLGPNGAGKSTMIKMLTGVLVPTSGNIKVMNSIPHKNRRELSKYFGVVYGQRSQLWWDLPVKDSFELHRFIYKIPDGKYKDNFESYVELLEMKDFIDIPVRQLSLGQRMRAEIALSLLHDPKILYLDEPTIGLDVVGKYKIREFLKKLNKEKGVTIILTTHDLKDIEEICSRLLIINKGDCVFNGTVSDLKREIIGMNKKVCIEFADINKQDIRIPNAMLIKDEGLRKTFEVSNLSSAEIIKIIATHSGSIGISDFSINEEDIEDIIRKFFNNLNEPIELQSGNLS